MKLVIAVVQHQDAAMLIEALTSAGYRVTRISSEGGFLHEGNVTLFIGVPDEAVDHVLAQIRKHCYTRTRYVSPMPPMTGTGEYYPSSPIEVQVGGATVFVVGIEDHQRV